MNKQEHDIESKLETIEIEIASIRLSFAHVVFGINCPFIVFDKGKCTGHEHEIIPWDRIGDLNVLWPLIGISAKKYTIDRISLKIVFENRTVIECPNTDEPYELVNIWQKDGEYILTNYPI